MTDNKKQNKSKEYDLHSVIMQPSAIESEEAVLGAIMLERDKLDEVLEIIPSHECFYQESHQVIYSAIRNLFNRGSVVDLITITDELRKTGDLEQAGGAYYLTRLTMAVVSSAHAEIHARIIMEKHINRQLIKQSQQTIKRVLDDEDCFENLESSQKALAEIIDGQNEATFHISEAAKGSLQEIDWTRKNPGTLTGIPTGIKKLDELTNGWQNTDIIILAARPGQGKTAKAISYAYHAASAKIPVLFFSMEMSKNSITKRLISAESRIKMNDIKKGALTDSEWNRVVQTAQRISSLPIYFDERGGLTYLQVRNKARKMKKKKGIKLIIIDYLQLMTVPEVKGKNREAQISEISRELKALAKDLDVPIIALCQMNREIEKTKRKPISADLRESGALEQDASIIAFIHHEVVNNATSTKLIITKNREGETGEIDVDFLPEIQKWKGKEDQSFDGFEHFDLKPALAVGEIEEDPF